MEWRAFIAGLGGVAAFRAGAAGRVRKNPRTRWFEPHGPEPPLLT
jgi:hypothetical protein